MEKTWKAQAESIGEMSSFVAVYAARRGLPPKKIRQLTLAMEEFALNIVKYGRRSNQLHEIKVTLEARPRELVMHLADSGVPFNPLDVPEPDIRAGVPQRRLGGLGIFLARKMVDEIAYVRHEDKNVLTLVMHF